GFVDRLAASDRRHQIGVLLNVGERLLSLVRPDESSVETEYPVGTVAGTFGPHDVFGNIVLTAVDLATHAMEVHPVGEFEVHVKKVVLVSRHPASSSPHPHGLYRMAVCEPVNDIEVVDMLFNDVVARQPGPVDPVTDHPFHVGPFRIPLPVPQLP